jgi:hypothetical protein
MSLQTVSQSRRTPALVVGVFHAVVAIVVAATAMTRGSGPNGTPAGADPVSVQPALASSGASQQTTDESFVGQLPDTSQAFADPALMTRAGTEVATGSDARIERVALTAPLTVQLGGSATTVDVVYRITITAGPYVVRDMPAIVSIDGRALGVAMESADLSALTAFTFDASVLDGTTLGVSYGLPDATNAVWSTPLEVTGR